MQEEFVPGSARGKFMFFGIILGGIILLLLVDPVFDFLESRNQTLAELDPALALDNSVRQLLVVTIISAIASWGVAFYCFGLGLRVKKSGRWPPPGMCLPFRTKVRHGTYAKVTMVLLFLSVGILFLNSFVRIYAYYRVSQLRKEIISPHKPLKKDLKDGTRSSAS